MTDTTNNSAEAVVQAAIGYDFDTEETVDSFDLVVKTAAGDTTGLIIQMASPAHPQREAWEMAYKDRKRAALARSRGNLKGLGSAREEYDDETERLVACTLGWSGSKLPYSKAQARTIYCDPKRLHIRTQVRAALDDAESFTRRSATA
jgi:hypothetical protein